MDRDGLNYIGRDHASKDYVAAGMDFIKEAVGLPHGNAAISAAQDLLVNTNENRLAAFLSAYRDSSQDPATNAAISDCFSEAMRAYSKSPDGTDMPPMPGYIVQALAANPQLADTIDPKVIKKFINASLATANLPMDHYESASYTFKQIVALGKSHPEVLADVSDKTLENVLNATGHFGMGDNGHSWNTMLSEPVLRARIEARLKETGQKPAMEIIADRMHKPDVDISQTYKNLSHDLRDELNQVAAAHAPPPEDLIDPNHYTAARGAVKEAVPHHPDDKPAPAHSPPAAQVPLRGAAAGMGDRS